MVELDADAVAVDQRRGVGDADRRVDPCGDGVAEARQLVRFRPEVPQVHGLSVGAGSERLAVEIDIDATRERAVVKFSAAGLKLLRAVNPSAAEAVDAAHRACQPEGWIKAQIPIESIEDATRQLLRLGGEAEVLEPLVLRAAIAAEAGRVVALYGQKQRAPRGRP